MVSYLLVPYIAGFILLKIFPEYYFNLYPYIILFLFAFGILFYLFTNRAASIGRKQFVNSFLLITSLKFVVSAMIIVVYAWMENENAIAFAVTYFLFYVVLSVYEIRAFMRMPVKKSDVE